jgi:hypothetical protein
MDTFELFMEKNKELLPVFKTVIKQNKTLLSCLWAISIILLLCTGIMTNMFLSMVILIEITYATFKQLKLNNNNNLKTISKVWVSVCFVIISEYVFMSIVNIWFLHIILNILKLIVCQNSMILSELYDVYLVRWIEKCELFLISITNDDVENESNYDVLNKISTIWKSLSLPKKDN